MDGITAAATVIEKPTGPVIPTELEAVTLTVDVPEAVGVPLKTPEDESESPAGTAVAVNVMTGVPVAIN